MDTCAYEDLKEPGQRSHNETTAPHTIRVWGKIFQILASIGEEVLELIVAMLVMVMVERANGQQGLGVYAYLAACLYAVRYLANFGVARHAERQTALTQKKYYRKCSARSGSS